MLFHYREKYPGSIGWWKLFSPADALCGAVGRWATGRWLGALGAAASVFFSLSGSILYYTEPTGNIWVTRFHRSRLGERISMSRSGVVGLSGICDGVLRHVTRDERRRHRIVTSISRTIFLWGERCACIWYGPVGAHLYKSSDPVWWCPSAWKIIFQLKKVCLS